MDKTISWAPPPSRAKGVARGSQGVPKESEEGPTVERITLLQVIKLGRCGHQNGLELHAPTPHVLHPTHIPQAKRRVSHEGRRNQGTWPENTGTILMYSACVQ